MATRKAATGMEAKCGKCKRSYPIEEFAPMPGNNNNRTKIPRFRAALADLVVLTACVVGRDAKATADAEAATTDAATELENARNKNCSGCRTTTSKNEQACNDKHDTMREAAAKANGGCCNQECKERGAGPEVWCVLEGDHNHGINDPDETLRKTKGLGEPTYWATHCGVKGMEKEGEQGVTWPCRCCHALDSLSSSSKRVVDKVDTVDKSSSKTTRRDLEIKAEKMVYVDQKKLEIGCCAMCRLEVTTDNVQCFDFDHVEEWVWAKFRASRKCAGVSGLVSKTDIQLTENKYMEAKHMPDITGLVIRTGRFWIDHEIGKCRLLCKNCHFRHTNAKRYNLVFEKGVDDNPGVWKVAA